MNPQVEAGRQTKPNSVVPPHYCTTAADGFNGLFRFTINGNLVRVIASDGEGWQHVSVSLEYEPSKPPTWFIMCKIKEMFWEPEEVVCQFHPRKSEYVNHHQGCLHLWRCTTQEFPTPPSILVGPK